MNRCSFFIKNKALFGGFPIQEYVDEYESIGVRHFVNLTYDSETKIKPYKTNYNYIQFSIKDHRVPTDWKLFAIFIIKIANIITNLSIGEKIYIHCKAGHGRSGVVVACLLCYLYKYPPSEAISKTNKYHNKRIILKEKWRKIGSPQTRSQKHFISKFFEPLYVYNNCYKNYFSYGFSNEANLTVVVPNYGMFLSAEAAFQSFKDPDNIEYVGKLEISSSSEETHTISCTCEKKADWDDTKDDIMYNILTLKFDQHKNIKNNLINTGLRPIIIVSDNNYWGYSDNLGKNKLGILLMKLRKKLYTS